MKNKKLEINLNDVEAIKELVSRESGLYATVNEDGEKVAVTIQQGEGIDVITYQHNSWIRQDSYNKIGLKTDEMFIGRVQNIKEKEKKND